MLLFIFLLFTICLILGTILYYKKIKQKVKENPTGAVTYGRNIIYGIVTGGSVIIVDKIVTQIFEGFSKINFSVNSWELFGSLLSVFIYTSFDVALIFFLIFYLISKGLPVIKR